MLRLLLNTFLTFLGTVAIILAGIYMYLLSLDGKKSDSKHIYLEGRNKPITFAHRGGMNEAPENTIAAFRNSVEQGIDALELDVRLSRDGEIMVFHDSTLDRTTDGKGKLEDFSRDELKKLDAGFRYSADKGKTFPLRGKGITIPTLEEVFKEFPKKLINIEHKRTSRQFTTELCVLIKKYDREDRVMVASVSDKILKDFRRECPGVSTSASFWEVTSFLLLHQIGLSDNFYADMDAIQIPGMVTGTDESLGSFVKAAKERNLEVHVFTVNNREKMKEALKNGVDGIMTDVPSVLAEVVEASN